MMTWLQGKGVTGAPRCYKLGYRSTVVLQRWLQGPKVLQRGYRGPKVIRRELENPNVLQRELQGELQGHQRVTGNPRC